MPSPYSTAIDIITGIGVGLGIGWVADHYMDSIPLCMTVGALLGLAGSLRNVYKIDRGP